MKFGCAGLAILIALGCAPFHAWGEDDIRDGPAATVPDASAEDTVSAPPSAADEVPEAEPLIFAVSAFRVDGNTILSQDRADEVLAPYLGPSRSVADVDAARAALERAYRDEGYPTVLVVVPEQQIEDGVVRLTVIEATLGAVRVTGNRYVSTSRLMAKLPSLRPGAVLHEPTLIEELDAVNATPDRQVAPVLTMGQVPGTVELEMKVHDRLPLHGNVEWNNRGTASTPDQRLSASVRYTDLFAREHTLALQTTQTPQDWGAVQVYSAGYVIPLDAGRTFSAYVATSNSQSALDGSSLSTTGGDVAITGNATVAGVRYTIPMRESHSLSVGLDYKRLGRSEAQFPGGLGTAVVSTPVSYAPVSVAYAANARDDWGTTRWSLSIKESISELVPGGGKREFGGDPENPFTTPGNRAGATGTFFVIQAGGGRVQQLDDGFSLSLAVDGQVASEPLIAAEQFFAGGIESVRGYVENEAQGDHGLRGSVDLSAPRVAIGGPSALQAALFADGAALWVKDAPPGQIDRHALFSLGLGARLAVTSRVQARLDHAWVLGDGPITRRGDGRSHLSLTVEF